MQEFLARLFKRLMKSWSWVLLVLLSVLIKWASWYPGWVESNYSRGVYPVISRIQRVLFGWIPFSIGDLFYAFLILIIVYKTGRFFKLLFKRRLNRQYFVAGLQQFIFFGLFVYVFFNLFWGLNYNRKGVSSQLELQLKPYSLADLDTLTSTLQQRANYYAVFVTEAQRDSFNRKGRLFRSAEEGYQAASLKYPFMKYRSRSIKPSLFSYLGNYLGFQGYYNPFSGEAQVNTTVPRFLEPFVTAHEMAHQLGYAKENEANFVGFLACKEYDNNAFRYSAYYDMYNYAVGEVFRRDTVLGKAFQDKAHPQVRKDQREFRDFYRRYKNPIEPIIMWGYGHFLKANNQPAGKASYNEVVAWLIAFYKKYGTAAL
ncbi:MAG: DUF3810 domain-containing protein [Chitinophagaceae bacterium]|nr:DUF3810 domain-containing protein [Chitinophagaceae bacterium]